MKRKFLFWSISQTFLSILFLLFIASPSMATSYNFSVDYSGNDIATLAAGSDDMLSTTLISGDSFIYTLQAVGDGEWSTIADGSLFPFIALGITESGARTGDFTTDLLNNSSNIFSYSESSAYNSTVHLGANTVSVTSGLLFDTISLTYSFTSGDDATPYSLLPWYGVGPENNTYWSDYISFNPNGSLVPEPSTMLLLGFGLVGLAGVTRKKIKK